MSKKRTKEEQRALQEFIRGGGRSARPPGGWRVRDASKFTLRLPPEIEDRLDSHLAARLERLSKNQWLVAAAREKLEREGG